MKRLTVRSIQGLLLLGEVLFLVFIVVLWKFSFTMAEMNPELAFMRVPVFLLALGVLLSLMAAFFFGFQAVTFYGRDRTFLRETAGALRRCSRSFLLGVVFLLGLYFYTRFHVKGSITNLYVLGAMVLFFLGNRVFALLTDVISEGIGMKEEQDLTI